MSTFILTDKEGKMVDWGVNHFPDGQQQFWITKGYGHLGTLTCVLRTSEDIDLFKQIVETVLVPKIDVLYAYGARSDKDEAGDRVVANVARNTFELLTDAGWHSAVTVLTPHTAEGMYDTFVSYYIPNNLKTGYDAWIFPDQSAFTRFKDQLPSGVTPVVATKRRDQVTGEIIAYDVNIEGVISPGSKCLVVDDICDGGRTFIELASNCTIPVSLDLYVTHGVFSNQAPQRLLAFYDNIHVTNSLCDLWALNREQMVWQENCPQLHYYDVWYNKGWKK